MGELAGRGVRRKESGMTDGKGRRRESGGVNRGVVVGVAGETVDGVLG